MRLALLFLLLCPAVLAAGTSTTYAYIYLKITNEPPVISSIALAPLYADSPILCNTTATDREGQPISYEYSWWRNGEPVAFDGALLPAGVVSSGDIVACQAVPYDPFDRGISAIVSSQVLQPPITAKMAKAVLSLAGVETATVELMPSVKKGMLSTTGFVVGEMSHAAIPRIGIIALLVGLLVLVNVNLLIRSRTRRTIS